MAFERGYDYVSLEAAHDRIISVLMHRKDLKALVGLIGSFIRSDVGVQM